MAAANHCLQPLGLAPQKARRFGQAAEAERWAGMLKRQGYL